MNENTVYIGDGVYARFDGFGVWLSTGNPDLPNNEIYLEPAVLASLNLVWQRWTEANNEEPDND